MIIHVPFASFQELGYATKGGTLYDHTRVSRAARSLEHGPRRAVSRYASCVKHMFMARARSRTPNTAYAGVHTRDPQHLPWLASRTGRCSIWCECNARQAVKHERWWFRPTATGAVARLTTSSQALRAGEMVTPTSPLTDLRCSRIFEDLRSDSALRRTRWLQVGCSAVATRWSSRMTCACALGAQATC
jgi:hypothetical protein